MADYEQMGISEVLRLAKQGDKDALFEMVWRLDDKYLPDELLPMKDRSNPEERCAWQDFWWEKAVAAGHIDAKFQYACSLTNRPPDAEYRQKAMSLFRSLIDDFECGKIDEEDGKMVKVLLGFMFFEGYYTTRDTVKGVELIEEAKQNTDGVDSLGFTTLFKLGELYAAGFAQPSEEPSVADLEQAQKYLEAAIKCFNPEKGNPKKLALAKQLLENTKKWIEPKAFLGAFLEGELTGFPGANKRRKEMMELSDAVQKRMEAEKAAVIRLHQRLAKKGWNFIVSEEISLNSDNLLLDTETNQREIQATVTNIVKIQTEDFYITNKRTIANSKEFDLTLDEKSNFPSEGIYIGEFVSASGFKALALLPLEQTNGLCFLTHSDNRELIHQTMQSIALRLVLSLPPGLCKFTLYDGTGSGRNLISLSDISPKIKGENILNKPDEMKRALLTVETDIPNIIQKILGQKHFNKSLIEYNMEAGDLAKPYHFIFITDFPQTLAKEHCESIEKIIKSGRQAGVFIIMSYDAQYQRKNTYDYDPKTILESMTTIYEADNRYYIKNLPNEKLFNTFRLYLDNSFPDYDTLKKIQDRVNKSLKEIKTAIVDITANLDEDYLWKENGSLGVKTPIGKTNITDIHDFTLSIEDGSSDTPHHCLIGGATGAGKTVLLHNIICNTAWMYSPDDIQFILLDYKEGTEFKPYENLPHVKVLSIRSEREYGVSVFNFLNDEIERRGEKFKEIDVSNIAKFNEKSAEKLPRYLVVIDEFQVLLDGDTRTAMFISKALDDIGRRGRSFGINLILSTQSLGGVDIHNALSHLGLRICLKLNTTKDCDQLLGPMNHVPFSSLTKKGEAIYNARSGLTEGNIKFQTAYLSDTKLLSQISNIKEKVVERYQTDKPFRRFIYDGNEKADIQNNPDLKQEFSKNDRKCTVYIGEPVALDENHSRYTLRRQNEANVLIIGQDTASAVAIIYHSLNQIIPQSVEDARFYICEKINVDSDDSGKISPLEEKYPNLKVAERDTAIEKVITDVFMELEKRKAEDKVSYRIVLVLSDIYNARILRKTSFEPPAITKSLIAILKDGPSFGIHTMVYANSYANFSAILDPAMLNEFEIKIELRGGEGFKMFGSANIDAQKSSPTKKYIANLKTPQQDENQKIKIYTL